MAFLDNSGDIILDAVLTDAGRQRMARGSFKIVKFALGDEEINYESFNSSHASGSAFYDLDIMQTPVLEAFTNNASLMKSKLVSLDRNNILYMPIFKLNDISQNNNKKYSGFDGYYLLADNKTAQNGGTSTVSVTTEGIMYGTNFANKKTTHITVDQGLDTQDGGLSVRNKLPSDLQETAFLVRVDHRLLRLQGPETERSSVTGLSSITELVASSIDDDAIATYYMALGDQTRSVFGDRANIPGESRHRHEVDAVNDLADVTKFESFSGPLGTCLQIVLKTSIEVQSSVSLFNELGAASSTVITLASAQNVGAHKFIDTTINIVGVTTGYSIDIPIRIIRKN